MNSSETALISAESYKISETALFSADLLWDFNPGWGTLKGELEKFLKQTKLFRKSKVKAVFNPEIKLSQHKGRRVSLLVQVLVGKELSNVVNEEHIVKNDKQLYVSN